MDPTPTLDTPEDDYPIEVALQVALREAKGDQAATSAALLDIAIVRDHRFGSLVAMMRTDRIRVEEPRRMSVTAKAALLSQIGEDDVLPGVARSVALARRIVDDLDVPAAERDEVTRRAVLLARECLPREPRQRHRAKA